MQASKLSFFPVRQIFRKKYDCKSPRKRHLRRGETKVTLLPIGFSAKKLFFFAVENLNDIDFGLALPCRAENVSGLSFWKRAVLEVSEGYKVCAESWVCF